MITSDINVVSDINVYNLIREGLFFVYLYSLLAL